MNSLHPERFRPLSLAPVAGIGLAGLVAAILLGLRPTDPSTAAAIFPIWWSQARTLEATDQAGAVIGVGSAPFVAIAHAKGGDLASRLYASGAWLVIDPGLAKACGA